MLNRVNLLEQVIDYAKKNGLDQKDIADLAGIQPESLSRAKKTGDMRLSSFTELVRAAGLQLTLAPDSPLINKIDSGTLFE